MNQLLGFLFEDIPHPQRDPESGRTRLFNLPCLAMAAGGTMSTSGMAPMGSEMCRCVGADAFAAPDRAWPGRLSRAFSKKPVCAQNCFTSLTTSGEALTTGVMLNPSGWLDTSWCIALRCNRQLPPQCGPSTQIEIGNSEKVTPAYAEDRWRSLTLHVLPSRCTLIASADRACRLPELTVPDLYVVIK